MQREKLNYPQWQVPLQEVILEPNLEKLPGKIHKVEALIADRLLQLQSSKDGAGECQAINDALDTLRTIKRERLQYPDWN